MENTNIEQINENQINENQLDEIKEVKPKGRVYIKKRPEGCGRQVNQIKKHLMVSQLIQTILKIIIKKTKHKKFNVIFVKWKFVRQV